MLVHRLAIATAAATFLLILIGGLVHATGSSLACPDWPLCYGSALPAMKGGVAVEHSHRLAAATVVILTVVLLVALHRRRRDEPRLIQVGWLALGLVIAQALLGGITVLLRLPTTVSTLHTATSLLFFTSVLWLAFRTRPVPAGAAPSAGAEPASGEAEGAAAGSAMVAATDAPAAIGAGAATDAAAGALAPAAIYAALIAAVTIYFQMVLGGLVRHSGAAMLCTSEQAGEIVSFPLCRGAFWPSGAHPTVLVHVLHRMGALLSTALVLVSSVMVFRAAAGRAWLRRLALAAPVLVIAQVALGVFSVQTFLALWAVELHLAVATALLATQIAIVLLARPVPTGLHEGARGLWGAVRDGVRLTKPRITSLVVATFAGGLWLAPNHLPLWRSVMTLVGTVLIVGASNALNMLLERDADALMTRTRNRPLPRHRVTPELAVALATGMAAAALPLLILGGNPATGLLAVLAFGSYVGLYTPMKRRSAAALFVGAVPGAIPPLMGWTAATGAIDAPGLVLFAILFLWQVPHFLAIAIFREEEYRGAGFKVMPSTHGGTFVRVTMLACAVGLVVASGALAPLNVAGTRYLAAAAVMGGVFVAWTALGFRRAGEAARHWARSLFFASLVYLTLLFAALIVDRTLT